MTTPPQRFAETELEAFRRLKILGVRSGSEHRYTGVWVVVVEDRVFIRSWNDKPTGWFRAFREEPRGSVSLEGTDRAIQACPVRSGKLRQAVTAAYAAKYPTKGSQKWVLGFAEKAREATTLELVPSRLPVE